MYFHFLLTSKNSKANCYFQSQKENGKYLQLKYGLSNVEFSVTFNIRYQWPVAPDRSGFARLKLHRKWLYVPTYLLVLSTQVTKLILHYVSSSRDNFEALITAQFGHCYSLSIGRTTKLFATKLLLTNITPPLRQNA